MARWPKVIFDRPPDMKGLRETAERAGIPPPPKEPSLRSVLKDRGMTVSDLAREVDIKESLVPKNLLVGKILDGFNSLIVKKSSDKLLTRLRDRKTRRGQTAPSTRRAAISSQAIDLLRQCHDADITAPSILTDLIEECLGVRDIKGPVSLLTSNQLRMAEIDVLSYPKKRPAIEVANELGVDRKTVGEFRKHELYHPSIVALVALPPETDAIKQGRRSDCLGWDDVINIEAKIHEWANGLDYPIALPLALENSPKQKAKFNSAEDLAKHLIKHRLIPEKIQ